MKKICLFFVLLLTLIPFSGCGAASTSAADCTVAAEPAEYEMAAEAAPAEYEAVDAAPPEYENSTGMVTGISTGEFSDKIIYTAHAEIETTAFDDSTAAVTELLELFGGFTESSSVTGSNLQEDLYGCSACRTASYTLRIPQENFTAVTSWLPQIGNVIYLSSDASNITAQYTDTESRLTALRTEETRLLEILSQAATVEEMITVETRLSEIRYQVEQLTSQLTNWDHQVSYSTVTLFIQEVEILTPQPTEKLTYWQEVAQGLQGTLRWMGNSGKQLLKLFISGLPLILPLGLLTALILLLHRRKHAAPKQADPHSREDTAPEDMK